MRSYLDEEFNPIEKGTHLYDGEIIATVMEDSEGLYIMIDNWKVYLDSMSHQEIRDNEGNPVTLIEDYVTIDVC